VQQQDVGYTKFQVPFTILELYVTFGQVIYLQNVMAAMQKIFCKFRFDDNN
jgi:hypothetical protein